MLKLLLIFKRNWPKHIKPRRVKRHEDKLFFEGVTIIEESCVNIVPPDLATWYPVTIRDRICVNIVTADPAAGEGMILSDGGIQARLNDQSLKVEPLDTSCIQPASLDLKLGEQFVIVRHWGGDVLDFNSEPEYQTVLTDTFLVPSHSFVLATTVEKLSLPNDLTAFVEGRSSVGRMGLFIQNAGWVDPGFEGQLTLELYNANSLPIRLRAGRRICQIVFCKMDQKTQNPYKGKYQGQKGAQGTRIFLDRENRLPKGHKV